MTLTAMTIALAIRKDNPSVRPQTAEKYATVVLEQANKRELDPWLIFAVVTRESHWVAKATRKEPDGTCSTGLGQINTPCIAALTEPLKDPIVNLRRVGDTLAHLRATCRSKCDDLGWLRGYNASTAYLMAVRFAVEVQHANNREQAVLQVPVEVSMAGMPWATAGRASRKCWVESGSDSL